VHLKWTGYLQSPHGDHLGFFLYIHLASVKLDDGAGFAADPGQAQYQQYNNSEHDPHNIPSRIRAWTTAVGSFVGNIWPEMGALRVSRDQVFHTHCIVGLAHIKRCIPGLQPGMRLCT
jgi:hypothetical protein